MPDEIADEIELPRCECGADLDDLVEVVETTGRAFVWRSDLGLFEVIDTSGKRSEETVRTVCSYCNRPLTPEALEWFGKQRTDEDHDAEEE